MKVILQSSEFGLGYELIPKSKARAKELLEETGEESILVDSDWDFPGLAKSLGWNGDRYEPTPNDGYLEKSRKISLAIQSAREFLDKRVDQVFSGSLDDYFHAILW